MLKAMFKDRGLTLWCPSSFDIGDKQKPGFIEEDEMGTKPFGLFLYKANDTSSNVQLSPRSSPEPFSLVSDSSSPEKLAVSRCGWDGSGCEIASRLTLVLAWLSRDRLSSRNEWLPLKGVSQVSPSAFWRALEVCQAPALGQGLCPLLSDRPATNERPSSPNNLSSWLLPADFWCFSAVKWRAGAAVLTAFGFHMVS
jgi:hypothetical protein